MRKKRIVCFGDSNTWGYDPVNHTRYDESTRWTMVLQSLLGEEYQLIEEGQNGRTIANPDPWEWGTKCGLGLCVADDRDAQSLRSADHYVGK